MDVARRGATSAGESGDLDEAGRAWLDRFLAREMVAERDHQGTKVLAKDAHIGAASGPGNAVGDAFLGAAGGGVMEVDTGESVGVEAV